MDFYDTSSRKPPVAFAHLSQALCLLGITLDSLLTGTLYIVQYFLRLMILNLDCASDSNKGLV